MARYWAGGTAPRNTNVSVPRLTPERNVRTITSSGPGSDSVTGRISPQPGARSQNAYASACAGLTTRGLGVNGPVEANRAREAANRTSSDIVFGSKPIGEPPA